MILQKQLTGEVLILDNSIIIDSIQEDCTINCLPMRSGLEIIDKTGRRFNISLSRVEGTQVLPAAVVPFSGSLSDLYTLLVGSFFNEFHTGSGGAVTSDDVTNLSTVAGINVTNALDTLNAKFIFPKLELSGVLSISSEISDTIISNQNDYSPIGFQDNTILNITVVGNRQITGFAAPIGDKVIKIIRNVFGGGSISLRNQDVASIAENRMRLNNNETLDSGESAILWYNQNISRWNILATYQ